MPASLSPSVPENLPFRAQLQDPLGTGCDRDVHTSFGVTVSVMLLRVGAGLSGPDAQRLTFFHPGNLCREIGKKRQALYGGDCFERHTRLCLFRAERRIGAQQLTWLQLPSFVLELNERLQAQIPA